jgi:ribosomal protein S12 methylthiotransferase accessory factor
VSATEAQFTSTAVNRSWYPMKYRMTDYEASGVSDLMRFYSPYGPIRRMITYFGVGGNLPLYSGHVYNYDYDYILRKTLGLSGFQAQLNRALYAGGKGSNLHDMFCASLAESVERGLGMLAWFEQVGSVVYGSYKTLSAQGYPCVAPDELGLFAAEQYAEPDFPYVPFTDDSYVGWIEGRRLISGDPVWFPAQLAAIFYPPVNKDEEQVGYSSSGGLASHVNEREAILHGILEIFERDAVNIHWYSWIRPKKVVMDRPPELRELGRLLDLSKSFGAQPTFYLHPLDFPEIRVLTAIEYHDHFTRYKYYAGGGVSPDIEECLLSAVGEFGQAMVPLGISLAAPGWGLSHAMDRLFGVDEAATQSELNVFIKILSYYGYKENFERLRWYVDTDQEIGLSEIDRVHLNSLDERWDYVLQTLGAHGIDPIVFDFTPPQFSTVKLMKTFITELSPPFLPSLPMLGNPRYYRLGHELGVHPEPLTYEGLNPDPMPYP